MKTQLVSGFENSEKSQQFEKHQVLKAGDLLQISNINNPNWIAPWVGYKIGGCFVKNIEEIIQENFVDVLYESGGEFYLPIIATSKFIKWCEESQIIIYAIDLFEKFGTRVTPYSETMSIDSSTLFDEDLAWNLNVKKCNLFIEERANALSLSNPSLYFSFVVESDTETT